MYPVQILSPCIKLTIHHALCVKFSSFRSGSIILKYMIKMKSNKDMAKTEMHQDVISTIQSNSASLSATSITMEPVENVLTSVGRKLNICHCKFFVEQLFLVKLIKYLTHILSCHLHIKIIYIHFLSQIVTFRYK